MDYLASVLENPQEDMEPGVVIMTVYWGVNLQLPPEIVSSKKKPKWQLECHQGSEKKMTSPLVTDLTGNPYWETTEAIELNASMEPLELHLLCRGRIAGQAFLPVAQLAHSEAAAVPTEIPIGGGGVRYRCWVAATRRARHHQASRSPLLDAAASRGRPRRMSVPAVRMAWRRLRGQQQRLGDVAPPGGGENDNEGGKKEQRNVSEPDTSQSDSDSSDSGNGGGPMATDTAADPAYAELPDGPRLGRAPPRLLLELRVEGLRSELEAVRRDTARVLARLFRAEGAISAAQIRVADAEASHRSVVCQGEERLEELTAFIDRLTVRVIDSGEQHLLERRIPVICLPGGD